MNKQEFLSKLRAGLRGAPEAEIAERLTFYGEMIDDRIEDGIPEEAAILEMGSPDELVSQIIADIPLTKLVKNKIKPRRRLNAFEIVLLALGSPIWLSLIIALAAVFISAYVVLWSVILCLWAAFSAFAGSGLAGVLGGAAFLVMGKGISGVAVIGAGIFCAGLSIFMFFGCRVATKSILRVTKKLALWIKNCFIKKEEV